MDHIDCIVIGAGVVGLAIAAELAKQGVDVCVLEQHDSIGSEISSRNSEVIHAGIYYPRDSLKAQLCVRGKALMYEHCEEFGVPYLRCGKLIVATNEQQVEVVKAYIGKARDNGVEDLVWQSSSQVAELEPQIDSCGAVLSPSTGIIDSHAFMLSLQGIVEGHGGMVAFQTEVCSTQYADTRHIIHTKDYTLSCRWLVNCAGLHAPGLALSQPLTKTQWQQPKAYYAKGHYYAYAGQQPFARLIYPVAVEGGLGVHVTLDLGGQVKFGPDVHWLNKIDYSFDESIFDEFVTAIEHYYPGLDARRLHPGYTGIRPKLAPQGSEFCDFRIDSVAQHGIPNRVDLLGIESPGLTASLAIAQLVAGQLIQTAHQRKQL